MEPTLSPGQWALLDRNYYRIHAVERGDVVVFRWKGQLYVKRVYALPGDTVTLASHQGYTWPVTGSLIAKCRRLQDDNFAVRSEVVPPGSLFCVGDNLPASVDSRDLGAIPEEALLGRVRL